MCIDRKQTGFTLIELMVTVAVFAVLASFAVPSYQNMIENSKIKTVTDSILTGMQIARAEAVSRNSQVQFDFRSGAAWTVCVSPASAGNCPDPDDLTTIDSRTVNEGSATHVTVSEGGSGGPYVFNGFGGLESPTTSTQIDIGNNALSGSRDLRIVVGVGGAVKSCDPALDSGGTDPRRC